MPPLLREFSSRIILAMVGGFGELIPEKVRRGCCDRTGFFALAKAEIYSSDSMMSSSFSDSLMSSSRNTSNATIVRWRVNVQAAAQSVTGK
jgi:hypothetical protein